jgi:hypothetical protein
MAGGDGAIREDEDDREMGTGFTWFPEDTTEGDDKD